MIWWRLAVVAGRYRVQGWCVRAQILISPVPLTSGWMLWRNNPPEREMCLVKQSGAVDAWCSVVWCDRQVPGTDVPRSTPAPSHARTCHLEHVMPPFSYPPKRPLDVCPSILSCPSLALLGAAAFRSRLLASERHMYKVDDRARLCVAQRLRLSFAFLSFSPSSLYICHSYRLAHQHQHEDINSRHYLCSLGCDG